MHVNNFSHILTEVKIFQINMDKELDDKNLLVTHKEKIIEIELDAEDMDPKLVLFGDDNISVKIPVPNAIVFNNLDEYYKNAFNKKNAEQKIKNKNAGNPSNKVRENIAFNIKSKGRPKLPDVIQKMNNQGPLSILYTSIKRQIKVLIRRKKLCSFNERFVWLTGELVAFDKHFNIILKNSLETYRKKTSAVDQYRIINKKSEQTFIRGDNVVIIIKT